MRSAGARRGRGAADRGGRPGRGGGGDGGGGMRCGRRAPAAVVRRQIEGSRGMRPLPTKYASREKHRNPYRMFKFGGAIGALGGPSPASPVNPLEAGAR